MSPQNPAIDPRRTALLIMDYQPAVLDGLGRAPKNKLERGGSAYPLASVKKLTLLPAQDSKGGQASTRSRGRYAFSLVSIYAS